MPCGTLISLRLLLLILNHYFILLGPLVFSTDPDLGFHSDESDANLRPLEYLIVYRDTSSVGTGTGMYGINEKIV